MGNLISYLKECGQQTFAEVPFRQPDSLVLSYLVYYNLNGIVPSPKEHRSVTIADAGRAYLDKRKDTQKDVSADVFRALIRTPRFLDARLSCYVDLFRTGRTQFAAIRISFPDGTEYLAFRGSDNSLTSWQEAFAISYQVTPAQKMAAEWFSRIMQIQGAAHHPAFSDGPSDDCTGRPLYLGGHSKGGNMALYAATVSESSLRSRITHIWLHDSPGLTPGFCDPHTIQELRPRTTRIVPAYSLIGRLFQKDAPDLIVRCSTDGINQHEPLFWQIEDGQFSAADSPDPACIEAAHTLNRWISHASLSARKHFTEDLFRALRRWRAEGGTAVPQPHTPGTTKASPGTEADAFPLLGGTRQELLRFLVVFCISATPAGLLTALRLPAGFAADALPRKRNRRS